MPFEAYKVLSRILFHVSLTTNVRGIILLKLPTRKLRLRDKRFVQGHPEVPVSPCLFSVPFLLLPALFCITEIYTFPAPWPVASRQVWRIGVYDRKLGERGGEAAVSSPLFASRGISSCGFMCSVPPAPAKQMLWLLGSCNTMFSRVPPVMSSCVANLWFLTIPCGLSVLLSPMHPTPYIIFPMLKDLEWLLFSWLENYYDEELHAEQKRFETAFQTHIYMYVYVCVALWIGERLVLRKPACIYVTLNLETLAQCLACKMHQ